MAHERQWVVNYVHTKCLFNVRGPSTENPVLTETAICVLYGQCVQRSHWNADYAARTTDYTATTGTDSASADGV